MKHENLMPPRPCCEHITNAIKTGYISYIEDNVGNKKYNYSYSLSFTKSIKLPSGIKIRFISISYCPFCGKYLKQETK